MPDFTPDTAAELITTIQDASEDVAGAFGRGLDRECTITVGDAEPLDSSVLPETWGGPGLLVALQIGDSGALVWLPEASSMLPEWCAEPDVTGKSKLATLAQELGIVLLPEALAATASDASYLPDLRSQFEQCDPAASVATIPITLTSGEKTAAAQLIWPVRDPMAPMATLDDTNDSGASEEPVAGESANSSDTPSTANVTSKDSSRTPIQYADLEDGIRQLPTYGRSLLKVAVPVTVTLATTKRSVDQILKLGPGSILQFEKRCEENLHLEIGGQTIAEGEAVKVGDKFGLWVTSMTMPGERFWIANGQRTGTRVQ